MIFNQIFWWRQTCLISWFLIKEADFREIALSKNFALLQNWTTLITWQLPGWPKISVSDPDSLNQDPKTGQRRALYDKWKDADKTRNYQRMTSLYSFRWQWQRRPFHDTRENVADTRWPCIMVDADVSSLENRWREAHTVYLCQVMKYIYVSASVTVTEYILPQCCNNLDARFWQYIWQ